MTDKHRRFLCLGSQDREERMKNHQCLLVCRKMQYSNDTDFVCMQALRSEDKFFPCVRFHVHTGGRSPGLQMIGYEKIRKQWKKVRKNQFTLFLTEFREFRHILMTPRSSQTQVSKAAVFFDIQVLFWVRVIYLGVCTYLLWS